jgi:hypothetical protein
MMPISTSLRVSETMRRTMHMKYVAFCALLTGIMLGLLAPTAFAGNVVAPDRGSQQNVEIEKSNAIVASARTEKYTWVVPKLPKDLNSIEKSEFTTGFIGQQKYVAIKLDADEPKTGAWVLVVIAKLNTDHSYDPIEVKKFYPSDIPRIRIENNSIYIRGDTAHHGIYFAEHQYKLRNGTFRLVGTESQSITLSQPENRPKRDNCQGKLFEMWEGSSLNYLNSTEFRWEQAFLGKTRSKAMQNAQEKFNKGLAPTNAMKRYFQLKPTNLLTLEDPILAEMDMK